ncbi:MAG TPA: tRNA pseudouridine(38-40) synthase TruA [Acidimicrobiales bacterium]|nr:tRNA pseudouridine(38-40) synthase TruA [Acidimicrobiales bacterium]
MTDQGVPPTGGAQPEVVRWRLRVAYDGSGFRGFAAQDGQPTVGGALTDALRRVTQTQVALTCAGRTDAGVHAHDQVIHFDLPAPQAAKLDPAAVMHSVNRQLGPAIVVREAGEVPLTFSARRSATGRRYRYLVVNAPVPDPLLATVAWHVSDPLDLRTMAAAADALLGEHDFRAFCRRAPGTTAEDPIFRRVTDARWSLVDGSRGNALVPVEGCLLAFEIEANAFCHQMVRSLVGTLVDVGRGRKRASDITWILRSADRQQASQPAPPGGLTLMAVRYGEGPACPPG